MSKILVTGSRGSLGRPLVVRLRSLGHEVWEIDAAHAPGERFIRANVGSYPQLERVFDQDYEYVYHLAAEFGRHNGDAYYETLWHTNVIGTRHILEWQRKRGFKLIFLSSSEIYGDAPGEWLDESLPERKPILQHNEYALTKWVNEVQIVNFEKRFETPVMRLRLFNAYGPGEYYHPYRSVVCQFIYRALRNLPYTVFTGYTRVFMYIDDLIRTLANSVTAFHPGEVYNVGGRENRSVEELSELVLRHTGADPKLVRFEPSDPHNRIHKRPRIDKAERDLGHNPRISLDRGVPRTVKWMKTIYGRP